MIAALVTVAFIAEAAGFLHQASQLRGEKGVRAQVLPGPKPQPTRAPAAVAVPSGTAPTTAPPGTVGPPTSSPPTSIRGGFAYSPPASTQATTAPTTASPETVGPPSSVAGGFAYSLPASTQITVAAVTACWLEIRTSEGGQVLYADTLAAGATKVFASPLWLQFGCDPSGLHVSAGAASLQLPYASPGDLLIQ